MAKKSRRARRRMSTIAQPVRVSQTQTVRIPVSQPVAREVNLEEYRYVVEDLKRIALIALMLLALLLVLAVLIGGR
ncbi:MAG: hypothetical protein ACUVWZ_14675 [Anaerolineae bacterium]